MTEEEATTKTKELFGDDSFTEFDNDDTGVTRYYVGACPKNPGKYSGYMGYSWEQALAIAKNFIG